MANRLAAAQSLYLRKHAENPIDWWSWCDEAIATARRDNKPIFLSIGYSSCHWCTVMEGEAFSDLTIAEYLNAHFLPIKVDREERPDLDSLYMQTLQMLIGQGGWPLNVFLSPDDLVPFYGGTYFPVEPRYGRPGFLQVLQALRRYYEGETDKLQSIKQEILQNLRNAVTSKPAGAIDPAVLRHGLEFNTEILASKAPGPRFPMIPYAEVALRFSRFETDASHNAAAISQERGRNLALGGIFDQVGGGFHRYSVDPTWTVPHFEKMLYDNGQIVEYLANLWSAGIQEPAFERAIALTVHWLQREMTAPAGYFYAAQDADSFATATAAEPEEGAFYVWSLAELEQHLAPAELTELQAQFYISAAGNFEGQIVLQRQQGGVFSQIVDSAIAKLFQQRYGTSEPAVFPPACTNQQAKATPWPGRIPPVTDTKMIVAWNSLMISGLARAAVVFGHAEYLDLAATAAEFILEHQWVNDRLHRLNYDGQPSILAQSEDYALLIKALLDLHQASLGSARSPQADHWLSQAVRVQREFDQFLWSSEAGGYYNTDANPDLLLRERSYVDNAMPSANGIAAVNLVRLSLLSENLQYLDRADRTLQSFASVMTEAPQACPSLFAALDWFQTQTLVCSTADTIAELSTHYCPTAALMLQSELPAGSVGLVCQGLSCQAPAVDRSQLWEQIRQSQIRCESLTELKSQHFVNISTID
jgi:uncharacterized protein YyaL (SSP411 family)